METELDEKSRASLKAHIQSHMHLDGVMSFKNKFPDVNVIGIEEKELFYLHEFVTDMYYSAGDTSIVRKVFDDYNRILLWFRSEIALAKLIANMKAKGLKKGVIVMGQTHRHQFEVLFKVLRINGKTLHTVPWLLRSDEAN
jgi:predicted phosphodiesterase